MTPAKLRGTSVLYEFGRFARLLLLEGDNRVARIADWGFSARTGLTSGGKAMGEYREAFVKIDVAKPRDSDGGQVDAARALRTPLD